MMRFPVHCQSCGKEGEERMLITDIPYFQEVILMSFVCEYCGFRSTEVKPGGEIPDQGRTLVLQCTPGDSMEEDLRRDVIKSDSAGLSVCTAGGGGLHCVVDYKP